MVQYIGRAVRRKEDQRFLRGEGQFVGDIDLPGMLEGAVFRSPIAHGRIKSVDVSRAIELDGVIGVFTAADIGDVAGMPTTFVPKPELEICFQRPFARGKVRYVGEPLAFVVAINRYVAEDALDLIEVDIDSFDAVVDARLAAKPGGNLVHDDLGTNIADFFEAQRGDCEAALQASPHRLAASFATHRHTGVPMETRGVLAAVDESGILNVWGPTKIIHRTRTILATLLKCPEEKIRCIEPDIGGAFGFRGEFFPEDFLVPWAALHLGRPVRWIEDRREHFVATNHSRQQWHELEVGFDDAGHILAVRDRAMMDMGAYIRPNGLVSPQHTISGLPGPYRIPSFDLRLDCVLTNKTAHGSYRGPGQYEAAFVRERAVNMIAKRLGMDPADVRRVNLIDAADMPYRVGTYEYGHEVIYDGGNYRSAFEKALSTLGYEQARALQKQARAEGRYLGIGFASYVEPSGLGAWETAQARLGKSGKVRVCVGTASIGQGQQTTLAQVCADALGMDFANVTINRGDTALLSKGMGAWGSRSAVMGGGAVWGAATALKEKILTLAAFHLDMPVESLEIENGAVHCKVDRSRSASFAELARLAEDPQSGIPPQLREPLETKYTFEQPKDTFPYGTAAALVEVDALTGAVHILKYVIVTEVGKMINPDIVHGQIVGAMAQGIGGTIYEELLYDEDGQILSTTLADYLVPSASEMPDEVIVVVLEETPATSNPLGVKGAGEGGIVPAAAVLANAVEDALAPFGVEITSLPLSHDRLRAMIRKGALQ